MKPVLQTMTVGLTKAEIKASAWPNFKVGNCLQAAVASIFELPLRAVPHFSAYSDWDDRYVAWLDERGLGLICIEPPMHWLPAGAFYLATGKSPRGAFDHVVVMRDGALAHDPHPSGDGLVGEPTLLDWWVLKDPMTVPAVTYRCSFDEDGCCGDPGDGYYCGGCPMVPYDVLGQRLADMG